MNLASKSGLKRDLAETTQNYFYARLLIHTLSTRAQTLKCLGPLRNPHSHRTIFGHAGQQLSIPKWHAASDWHASYPFTTVKPEPPGFGCSEHVGSWLRYIRYTLSTQYHAIVWWNAGPKKCSVLTSNMKVQRLCAWVVWAWTSPSRHPVDPSFSSRGGRSWSRI